MGRKYTRSLFVFRRDLCLEDNIGLAHSLNNSEVVIPCFIFDPRQIENSEYKSNNALQFLIESIQDLSEELKKKKGKLYIFYGKAEEVIERLIKEENIDAIYLNKDYTPFSIKRDLAIKKAGDRKSISFKSFDDALLNKPGSILNKSGKPYTAKAVKN